MSGDEEKLFTIRVLSFNFNMNPTHHLNDWKLKSRFSRVTTKRIPTASQNHWRASKAKELQHYAKYWNMRRFFSGCFRSRQEVYIHHESDWHHQTNQEPRYFSEMIRIHLYSSESWLHCSARLPQMSPTVPSAAISAKPALSYVF